MGSARRTNATKKRFLESLKEYPNVSAAIRKCRLERTTMYKWRKEDPVFAAEWAEALDEGMEVLEDEAVRRADKGWLEPVFFQGKKCGSIRKYSDTLTIFLLKGTKPNKYRERSEVKHTGGVKAGVMMIPATATSEEWDEIAKGVAAKQKAMIEDADD